MSEPSMRLTQVPKKPGDAAPQAGLVPDDSALLRHSPERLEYLFRHVRGQQEGAYLWGLVRRYRRQTLP